MLEWNFVNSRTRRSFRGPRRKRKWRRHCWNHCYLSRTWSGFQPSKEAEEILWGLFCKEDRKQELSGLVSSTRTLVHTSKRCWLPLHPSKVNSHKYQKLFHLSKKNFFFILFHIFPIFKFLIFYYLKFF